MGLCLDFHRTKREKSGGQKQAKCAPPLSVLDLIRTSSNTDARTDLLKHDAGYSEAGVAIRTDWAEMRIPENAWSDSQQRQSGRRLDSAFMEGDGQTSVPSTGSPTLYLHRAAATVPRIRARGSASLRAAPAARPIAAQRFAFQEFTIRFLICVPKSRSATRRRTIAVFGGRVMTGPHTCYDRPAEGLGRNKGYGRLEGVGSLSSHVISG
jgi:hypothetical protein